MSEKQLIESIRDLPQFVRKLFYENDISELNLDINLTQTIILMFLDSNKNKSMSELSKLVGLEKSSFTRSVDYLEERKFIKRNYSGEDRRKIIISFTEKGLKAVKLIKDDWNEHFRSLVSTLSAEEQKEFSDAIKTVSKYIQQMLRRPRKDN
jgi:DNA-binding MarR family transcriptional regulator